MTTSAVESVEDLFDNQIDINQPIDWEFLGLDKSAGAWSRWDTYQAGQCVRLPNGEVWCARRNIRPGEVGPGETGWKHAWALNSTMLGADSAAEAAYAQRHHGRGGQAMLGADSAAEAAYAQRHHGRGGQAMLGALVADYHVLREAARGQAGVDHEMVGADPVSQAAASTQRIIERARDSRPPAQPPACVVEYLETDEISIEPVREEILGLDSGDVLDEANFPVVSQLYRHFQQERREPSYVRLDTDTSYRDFRADQSPDVAELRRKVDRLDTLLNSHLADGHGAQDTIVGLASDVSKLQSVSADKRVPLSMPPWTEGAWDCWREDGPRGGLVCCSIALPGHDGYVRICTAATPVANHVEDVVGYTHDVGCDVPTLLGVLPTIACMLAGSHLMGEMAAAAPHVLAHPGASGNQPFIGKIVPANHPTLAALIALFDRARKGDQQATREWSTLAQLSGRNDDLYATMTEARRRLENQSVVGEEEEWSRR